MSIETIPLSQLQMNPQGLLSECCDTGRPIIVELPDHRFVSIQSIEPGDVDDSLVDDLIASNAMFRALIQRSKQSPRKDFLK
jgi:hypothetical protein